MRIALIANNLREGGGKVVMMNLLPELLEILKKTKHEVLVIPSTTDFPTLEASNIKTIYPKGGNSTTRRFLWQKLSMEKVVRAFKPDWTFAMGNYAINNLSGKQTMFLHNLYMCTDFAKNGSIVFRGLTKLKQIQFKNSLKSVDRLYFQTNFVKGLFEKRFPDFDRQKNIMPLFIPNEIAKESAEGSREMVDGFFNLLYPASASVHKNQQIIVKTFAKYKDELKGVRCFLTLDSSKTPLGRELFDFVKAHKLEENIIFTGALARKDLSDMYRACDALLMTTKLETLGLPYLEAMHFSLPIITTDADFSRAVCADTALYCDSDSEESLKDAILRLKSSSTEMEFFKAKEREFIINNIKKPSEIAREILELEEISL